MTGTTPSERDAILELLQPRTVLSKRISGAGRWGVRYSDFGQPSFCAVVDGRCRLAVDGQRALTLEAGDFVLLPATPGFTMSGFQPVTPERLDPKVMAARTGEVRHGTRGGRPDVLLLGGYFVFGSPDAALLVSLLPALVHVRGAERLSTLVRLVGDESSEQRSGRDLVLTRLVEVLSSKRCARPRAKTRRLVCCAGWPMRARAGDTADARPARAFVDGGPAREASRAFPLRVLRAFRAHRGLAADGIFAAWRMAVAKDLLRRHDLGIAEVLQRVGYGSASTFSTAFSRRLGQPPRRYARSVGASLRM